MRSKLNLISYILALMMVFFCVKSYGKGDNNILLGGGFKSLSYGGTYSSSVENPLATANNPASVASLEMPALGITYGDIGGFHNLGLFDFSYPTPYGVFTGGIKYFNSGDANSSLDSLLNFNLSFSKIFTEKLFVGLGLNLSRSSFQNDSGFSGGLNIGFIYHLYPYNIKRTTYFKNLYLGLSILNIGYPVIYNDEVVAYPFVISPSVSARFVFSKFSLQPFIGISIQKFKKIVFNTGLEAIYEKNIFLRWGYSVNSDYRKFSAGFGYKFNIKGDIESEVGYTLIDTKYDSLTHYGGAIIYLGTEDNTPPEGKIGVSLNAISPNYDGKNDYLEIKLNVKDNRLLKGWEVDIMNKENEIVKKYTSPNIDVLKGKLTFKKILTKLFERKKEAEVPEKIVWDGTTEKGEKAPEGEYKVVVRAWDENLNKMESEPVKFILDVTPPSVKVKSDTLIFSPNGDGKKDTIKFTLDIKAEPDDEFKGVIKDDKGKVVREYIWKGNEKKEIVWDGKDQSGKDASEGLYHFYVTGTDKAGNSTLVSIKNITLTRKQFTVDITSSADSFSPNSDGVNDSVEFTVEVIPDTEGLEYWGIFIYDKEKRVVKKWEGKEWKGEKIVWKGEDNEGNKLPDGIYYYQVKARFIAGSTPESYLKQIQIDTAPPVLKYKISPEIFSPDGDEKDDTFELTLNVNDKSDIKDWKVTIYQISTNKEVFKVFKGEGMPAKKILWNGLSEDGRLVQSRYKYIAEIEMEDVLGNKVKKEIGEINISKVPPDVDFEFGPLPFSPDGDGINDILKIKLFSYDKRKIKSWKIEIYPYRFGKTKESLFYKFEGKELPDKPIKWDGRNDKGEMVESAMDYLMELTVEDVLGNKKKIVKKLPVDVLLEKTKYGWKIRISNIQFEYNKADLKGNAFRILDRVIELLERYPHYKVSIEGHTDSRGSDEYNLKLSLKRAESVYKYLVENGIEPERLFVHGWGESRPIAPNENPDGSDNPEGRAKNRRVEFLLFKPGWKLPAYLQPNVQEQKQGK